MSAQGLTPIDVSALEVVSNPCNLGRDLHVFARYVREREVKRSHRQNTLSKADVGRLAKLMSDPDGPADVKKDGDSPWVSYVDRLALRLGFVEYDTEGEYQGYTSSEPSYPDNYIEYQDSVYEGFLRLSSQNQEQRILDTLVERYRYDDNEFFHGAPRSRMDPFDYSGCATGVLPGLDFAKSRRFLLQSLGHGESGVWFASDSLIQYLKTHHPFFLIPRKPKITRGRNGGRYGNFAERRGNRWGEGKTIAETLPDAFERVEGRYVERFLEGIPLVLGYVDVAYGESKDPTLFPTLGRLKAFRVRPRLLRCIQGKIAPPRVTVQPNFEIHLESEAYPAQLMETLIPLADVVAEDTVTVLKLQKKKVSARLVEDRQLDVVALLKGLSDRPVPRNVVTELEEWSGHSEAFTLYDGFGLLEGDADIQAVEAATVERISPTLRIVASPGDLTEPLEQAERVPLLMKHDVPALKPLPKSANSVFPKQAERSRSKTSRLKVSLKREVRVTLQFPSTELLEVFRKGLSQARCALEVDRTRRTISFPHSCEVHVKDIVRQIKEDYQVHFEDREGS